MSSLRDRFQALTPERRRSVHFELCEHALRVWCEYTKRHWRIRYIESVCGSPQIVEKELPAEALQAARCGTDRENVRERYEEPIISMQDNDLEFPNRIEFAYYAIYNLFQKYALHEDIDDWLIVNQAVSSEESFRLGRRCCLRRSRRRRTQELPAIKREAARFRGPLPDGRSAVHARLGVSAAYGGRGRPPLHSQPIASVPQLTAGDGRATPTLPSS